MPSTQHQRRTEARKNQQQVRAAILRAQLAAASRDAERRNERYEAICKLMPLFISFRTREAYRRYVAIATAHLGKKALEHVVWPWTKRPERAHVARGKVRQ